MNRRSFIRGVFGVAFGTTVLSLVPVVDESPISVLRRVGKVCYKGIDWRLDRLTKYFRLVDQLYGESGNRCMVTLFDLEQLRDDKALRYWMDVLVRRFANVNNNG